MTTFIKTKFNISDDQTNINKYRLAANIIEYHIISKLIFKSVQKQEIGLLWSSESFEGKYNIRFGIPIELPSQRKKIIQIGPETTKLDCCGQDSHLWKVK